jgi:1-hydroxycarotenoid 3,4-desaturase
MDYEDALPAPDVIVVGAGIGGLTAALALARRGARVRVIEAQPSVGGKLRRIRHPGHEGIDSGPTVFTMRWVFDDLFDSLGLNFEDHVRLERLDLLARHGWSGAARLDLFADLDRTVDAIGAFAGAANANGYRSFCKTAARTFNTLDRTFMRASRPNPLSLTGRIARENIAGLAAIHPFQTLWSALSKSFSDPRLRQLFGRYATYTGGSPFLAPATLMLIAHAERQGVWLVDGGMRQLAVAFANLAEAAGAVVQCGDSVVSLRSGREGKPEITLASGERLTADAVVFNGDINALTTAMLDGADAAAMNRHQIAAKDRSQSAITFSAIASTAADDLAPHTVAFSDDYAREFDDVFVRHHPPNAPTVYIHAPDRPAAGGVPAGGGFVDGERVFLLVNAPANGGSRYGATEIAETQAAMNATLERSGFPLKLDPIRTTVTTPDDFARLFPATGGALYGAAPHGWQSSFKRLGSRTPLPRVYCAGGSVHPGPGVPMATMSGRLAAEAVLADLG